MYNSTDPRPPLSEWIIDAFDVLYTRSFNSEHHGAVQSISREQALDVLLKCDDVELEPEDATYALTRLLERGYVYEVDNELHVTLPEN